MYLRGALVVILAVVLATAGITIYARLAAHTAAGATTMPPDWPINVITVPATATDIYFNHDLRQIRDTGEEVLRNIPSKYGHNVPFTGPYLLYFNDLGPVSVVFDHFEQPLLAAGYAKGAGRGESQLAQYGMADRRYTSPDGTCEIQVRYWASAPAAYGGGQAQHWWVVITKR
jgi:hypothetical protein